jgi:hypothetical protein
MMTAEVLMMEGAKVRGRRPKWKPPTKLERNRTLTARVDSLTEELRRAGYDALLKTPGPITAIAPPLLDPKTNGMIAHAEEPLGTYLQRVSAVGNESQRQPFDQMVDPIYMRMIRDILGGALLPEAKVAVLSRRAPDKRAPSLDAPEIYYSIIDGLQRFMALGSAVLLVLEREKLVTDGVIPKDAWDYFKEPVERLGATRAAVERVLEYTVRYEAFYQIDLQGLLHYMVTFNTAQRRMSIQVQLEIMNEPMLQEFQRAGIPFTRETTTVKGESRPKDTFFAGELTVAAEAFLTSNPQVTPAAEAERGLDRAKTAGAFLTFDDAGEITDVVRALGRIATEVHPRIMKVYADGEFRHRVVLSGGGTFLIGLAAACGYVRKRINMKALDGALDKLVTELQSGKDDPLRLQAYDEALLKITSSRGKGIRRLVYDTFLRYFQGTTPDLDWEDAVRQITG